MLETLRGQVAISRNTTICGEPCVTGSVKMILFNYSNKGTKDEEEERGIVGVRRPLYQVWRHVPSPRPHASPPREFPGRATTPRTQVVHVLPVFYWPCCSAHRNTMLHAPRSTLHSPPFVTTQEEKDLQERVDKLLQTYQAVAERSQEVSICPPPPHPDANVVDLRLPKEIDFRLH